jgi:hypothetical protein
VSPGSGGGRFTGIASNVERSSLWSLTLAPAATFILTETPMKGVHHEFSQFFS